MSKQGTLSAPARNMLGVIWQQPGITFADLKAALGVPDTRPDHFRTEALLFRLRAKGFAHNTQPGVGHIATYEIKNAPALVKALRQPMTDKQEAEAQRQPVLLPQDLQQLVYSAKLDASLQPPRAKDPTRPGGLRVPDQASAAPIPVTPATPQAVERAPQPLIVEGLAHQPTGMAVRASNCTAVTYATYGEQRPVIRAGALDALRLPSRAGGRYTQSHAADNLGVVEAPARR